MKEGVHNDVSFMLQLLNQLMIAEVLTATCNTCITTGCLASTWHHHIRYITEKTWIRINIMRKLKFKLDRKSLETIYLTFIRPILEYGAVLWDNCS